MFFITILIFLSSLFSQPWMDDLTPQQQQNFYEIQRSFDQWVADKDISQKGLGIKQYKRWEEFWKHRVYPDGSFPSGKEFEEVFKSINKNKDKNPTLQNVGEWKFIGRTTSPGGYNGLGRINVVREDPNNSSIWWAGAASGGLWKTTNRGQSWTTNTDNIDNLSTLGVSDIVINPSNSNIMYLATGDRDGNNTYGVGVLKTTNGGQDWNTTGLSRVVNNYFIVNRLEMDPNDNNKLIAATNGGIYVTTDAGANWNRTLTNHCKDVKFKPGSSDIVYTSAYQSVGAFFKSTDGGSTWNPISSGLPSNDIRRIEIAVTDDEANNVYLLASAANHGLRGVYLSTNSGDDFTLLADSPNMLTHSKDGTGTGGQGWYDLTIAVPNDDKNTIFVGGVVTWKSTNLGSDWELNNFWYSIQNTPTVHADQHYFRFADDGTLLVGNDGGVYASTDKGDTWDFLSEGLGITQCYKISTSQETLDHFILGSQDNGTMLKRKNGTWTDSYGGDGMKCLIDETDEDIMYASIQYGDPIVKSTNNGQSWRRINDKNNNQEFDDIDETGAWVTPFDYDPSDNEIIYVGMSSLWKSTDGGDNFTKINVGNSQKFQEIYVSRKNPNYVYASTNNQFFKSTDKGQNWTEVSRPGTSSTSHFCIHPDNEEILWATNSGWNSSNKVFYSTDGGSNWSNISSGLPNLPVNCVEFQKDENNRIYIGTDIGVYYRDDNSGGWIYFSEGLPNVIVKYIDINEANGRMYAGTYGRGVWYVDLDIEIPIPTLNSPSDLSKFVSYSSLNLTWNEVNLATAYHIQVSKFNNFSTIAFENTNSTPTSFVISDLDKNQTYYWRVKAKAGGNESAWSEVWSFTTKIGIPNLVEPTNNEFNLVTNPEFRWNNIDGATSYDIQVSNNSEFTSLFKDESSNNFNVTYTGFAHNAKYYWRVRAKNTDGVGDWSEIWSFTTKLAKPNLSTPSNTALNIDPNVKLEWESVNGGQTYDIELDNNPNFSNPIKSFPNHGLIDVDVTNLQFAKEYFWRVQSKNSNSTSDWSDVWSFRTRLAQSDLIFPPNDSNYLDKSVNLLWSDITKSDTFNIQVSENHTFQNLLFEDKIFETNYNLEDLENNQLLYWRIKSSSTFGESNWSEIYNFRVKLETPVLSQPENSAEEIELDNTLSWDNVEFATKYLLQISESNDFNNFVINEEVTTNSFDYTFSNNKIYYWRVRGLSEDNLSDWSETFSFSTPIETPVLISPSNGSISNDTIITLLWNSIQGASEYQLDIADDDAFSNKVLDNEIVTKDNYELDLDFGNTYYWRVRAKINDDLTDYSEVWSFKVEKLIVLPSKVTLVSPVDGAIDIDTNSILVTWESADNANTYAVELSDSDDFSNKILNQNNITGTEYTFEDLEADKTHYWRVKAINNDGDGEYSDTWEFKTIKADPNSSVNIANFQGKEYKIYPNPAGDYIIISVENGRFDFNSLEIYDNSGNKVKEIEINQNNQLKIDIKDLSSGAYQVKLFSNDYSFSLRFVKN